MITEKMWLNDFVELNHIVLCVNKNNTWRNYIGGLKQNLSHNMAWHAPPRTSQFTQYISKTYSEQSIL